MKRAFFLFFALTAAWRAAAQSDPGVEPPMAEDRGATSAYAKQLMLGGAFNLVLSNFGFAMSGTLERPVLPFTSVYLSAGFTGLRDVSEQNFTNFLGQQFIPNKYNRIFSLPVLIGIKQRFFAQALSDNFRFNVHAGAGIARSFIYPYFMDSNGNQVWDQPTFESAGELIYDPLQGWDQGFWRNAVTGEFGVSVDFGDDFESFTSVYFGASIYHFKTGVQVLEPFSLKPVSGELVLVPDAKPRNLFVSPVIRFSFGNNWRTKR